MGYLRDLKVRHFRNLAAVELTFAPEVNLLVGNNAQGKTNLLESILYLATSTTPRTTRHYELVEKGEKTAYVSGLLEQSSPHQVNI